MLLGKLIFACLAPQAGILIGAYLAATGAILGHLFPVYFGFKGGQGGVGGDRARSSPLNR